MSSTIATLPAGALDSVKSYPETGPQTAAAPKLQEAHHAAAPPDSTALTPTALSRTDVSYVHSLMGVLPAQKMEQILLKTGIPIPAHLGPNIDTSA